MEITEQLPAERREQVETRLRTNQMAWLSTVTPEGAPVTVPVWFLLRDDGSFLLYSEPGKAKLRHLAANPRVSLVLDATDIGRDVVRVRGTAEVRDDEPPADRVEAYTAKYAERIETLFGTPQDFAAQYSVAVVITPDRLWA